MADNEMLPPVNNLSPPKKTVFFYKTHTDATE